MMRRCHATAGSTTKVKRPHHPQFSGKKSLDKGKQKNKRVATCRLPPPLCPTAMLPHLRHSTPLQLQRRSIRVQLQMPAVACDHPQIQNMVTKMWRNAQQTEVISKWRIARRQIRLSVQFSNAEQARLMRHSWMRSVE
jgi:hypothetical protein